uniref:Uncharacterized protein n=1 Tax=Cucumis melo TaxID=3656 RepID=A0A1S4DW41_CUCME
MSQKALDYESINENVKKAQYAVRGELYLRASELQKEGKKIIFTNVGNPHALGQKPLTFPRQVVALCQAPFLLEDPNVGLIFPADAIARAKSYLSLIPGGLVAYSDSRGIPAIRKEVADFIGRRDGYPKVIKIMMISTRILSFVLLDMGPPISNELQLISFHTVSKGYWGECGQRGGYFEMTNIPPRTVDEIYKVASISLSPNVPAQIFMGLMVNPPKPGDFSYDQYISESKGILESLRRRARIMTDGFNSCKNVVCNFTEGAMYSFPQIRLPPRAIESAKQLGKVPDVLYCLKLLEATGISTVPGSGFGQKEGVFHLRTTILPAEEDMPEIMASFKKFNDAFMEEYGA